MNEFSFKAIPEGEVGTWALYKLTETFPDGEFVSCVAEKEMLAPLVEHLSQEPIYF